MCDNLCCFILFHDKQTCKKCYITWKNLFYRFRAETRSTPSISGEIVDADSPESSFYESEDEEQEDVTQVCS